MRCCDDQLNPPGERGYECGGDGLAIAVSVRNGVEVRVGAACECDLAAIDPTAPSREDFDAFFAMYPSRSNATISPVVENGSWMVWSYSNCIDGKAEGGSMDC